MSGSGILRILFLLLLCVGGWAGSRWVSQQRAKPHLVRSLADYRIERWPDGVPAPWRSSLERRLRGAPECSLLDPAVAEVAVDLFRAEPWIEPSSVQVELVPPDGIRVAFLPRHAAFRIEDRSGRIGMATADGHLLPDAPELASTLPCSVELLQSGSWPVAAGGRFSDPAVQAVADLIRAEQNGVSEYAQILEAAGLPLLRITVLPGYPSDAPIKAPLLLEFEGGLCVEWGRPAAARDPLSHGLEWKRNALRSIRSALPSAARIDLDGPRAYAWDAHGVPLPVPDLE